MLIDRPDESVMTAEEREQAFWDFRGVEYKEGMELERARGRFYVAARITAWKGIVAGWLVPPQQKQA